MARLQELAETLQASVIDRAARMNFPTRHPLNQTERAGVVIRNADVILGLELSDFLGQRERVQGPVDRESTPIYKPTAKLISINWRRSLHEEQLSGLPALLRMWTSPSPPTPKPPCLRSPRP